MAAIEPAVHLLKAPPPGCESVLSGDAIAFLTMLARRFEPTRQELGGEIYGVGAGRPPGAALFYFGPRFLHSAAGLMGKAPGPSFYPPKPGTPREARLWNDVFNAAQDALGIGRGTIRATVLIETILAAFETDEILWELRNHSAGLNCGRWDYIFSYIKKFRLRPECLLPDRGLVTMDRPV